MKQFNRRIALVAALAVVLHLAVAPVSAKDNWTRLRTANFVLIGNADQKQMRGLATRLEQFRNAFTRLLPTLKYATKVPPNILVFNSLKAYGPFRPSNAAGHFQEGRDVDYIVLTTESPESQEVLFHEYTHLLLSNSSLRDVPTWFNEGLAEYYSTFSVTDDQKVTLGTIIPNHLESLREGKMLPLASLFAVDQKSPYYNEGQKQNIFYSESWLLVHYLIQGNKNARQAQLSKFIDLLLAKLPVEQAFQQAFNTTYAEMEKELQNYLRQNSHMVTVVSFERKLDSSTDVAMEPIGEAESQAYLGDLAAHMRLASSETYLKHALELDPSQNRALASLGMLYSEKGDFAQARPLLERALAADPRNFFLNYLYVEAMLRETENDSSLVAGIPPERIAKMRVLLQTAIEAEPSFTDSYRLLAYLSLMDGEQVDEAITLLKRALVTAKDRNDLLFMLGQCYLRQRDLVNARAALEIVAKTGETDELRNRSQQFLDRMAETEAREQRQKAAGENNGNSTDRDGPEDGQKAGPPQLKRQGIMRLRPLADGEVRVRGEFQKIECTGGRAVVLVVKTGDKEFRFHSSDLSTVKFTSFSPTLPGGQQITCGAFKTPQVVLATYKPNASGAKIDGEAVAIEFVPPETETP